MNIDKRAVIASFLPRSLVQLTAITPFPLPPFCAEFEGALLLVDISGFTKLSEILSEQGVWGLEQLSRHLNSFFSKIAQITDSFGGDIIKIAGDALLIVFRVLDDYDAAVEAGYENDHMQLHQRLRYLHAGKLNAINNAIKCAVRCVELSRTFHSPPSLHISRSTQKKDNIAKLSVHCGLSYGQLFDVICGGVHDAYEYLVCGDDAFRRLSSCLKVSQAGEVCVDENIVLAITQEKDHTSEYRFDRRDAVNAVYVIHPQKTKIKDAYATTSDMKSSVLGSGTQLLFSLRDTKINLATRGVKDWMQAIGCGTNAESKLSPYLPTLVRLRMLDDQFIFPPELRYCSIVFISLKSIVFHRRESMEEIQQCICIIQRVCHDREGFLRQFLVDDKGCVAILVFGAPRITHPDDAFRACAAALEISQSLAKKGFPSSIGCSTGRVFCGDVGSLSRREFAFVGSVVNTAAHLMTLNLGVLCTPKMRDSCRNRIAFSEPLMVKIKGHVGNFKAYSVESIREAEASTLEQSEIIDVNESDSANRLLFREEQEKQVAQFIESMLYQAPMQYEMKAVTSQAIVFSGEMGSGRKTLAGRVMQAAKRSNFQVVNTFGSLGGNCEPYFAIKVLVDQILEMDDEIPIEERTERVVDCVREMIKQSIHDLRDRMEGSFALHSLSRHDDGNPDDMIEEMFQENSASYSLLNSIFKVNIIDRTGRSMLSKSIATLITHRLILQMVSNVGRQIKLLIVIQEFEKMDMESIKIIKDLIQMQHQMYFCILSDSASLNQDQELTSFFRNSNQVTFVNLPPFDEDQALEFLRIQQERDVNMTLFKSLYAAIGGNPGYLKDALAIFSTADATDGGPADGELPGATDSFVIETMNAMVLRYVDRLESRALNVLKIASVIGMTFFMYEIERIYDTRTDKSTLTSYMEAALKLRLIRVVSEDHGCYKFSSRVIHEIVYNLLPLAQRRRMHEYYAKILEQEFATSILVFSSLIAHHYYESSNFNKAYEYYSIAARKDEENQSYSDAIAKLKKAKLCLDSASGIDRVKLVVSLNQKLGILCYHTKEYEDAIRFHQESCQLLGITLPATPAAQHLNVMGWMLFESGRYLKYRIALCSPNVENERKERGSLVQAGPTFQNMQNIMASDYTSNRQVSEAFIHRTGPVGHVPNSSDIDMAVTIVSVLQGMGESYLKLGQVTESQCALLKAFDIGRSSYRKELELQSICSICTAYFVQGHRNFATYLIEHVKSGMSSIQEESTITIISKIPDIIAPLLWVLVLENELDHLEDMCELAKTLIRSLKNVRRMGLFLLIQCQVYSVRGPCDRIMALLQEVVDIGMPFLYYPNFDELMITKAFIDIRFVQGDRKKNLRNLTALGLQTPPSANKTEMMYHMLQLGLMDNLVGYPIFTFELVDLVASSKLTLSLVLIQLMCVLLINCLAFLEKVRNGEFELTARIRRAIAYVEKPFLLQKLVNAKPLCLGDFVPNEEDLVGAIKLLQQNLARLSRRSLYSRVIEHRMKGYVAAITGDIPTACRLFMSGAEFAAVSNSLVEVAFCALAYEKFSGEAFSSPSYPSINVILEKVMLKQYEDRLRSESMHV
eukprot:TRINITY_DN4112_c0_g2_i11.p1 TRINITY_DN4112_c0_g2~~TRINITY_DN4112_c0_g2_i11.p1  ORF type:complete len:1587 (-),score=297.57 TRINITY_DN4112_c0_g2_i11:4474-9234(-)